MLRPLEPQQYTSFAFGQQCRQAEIRPSIGSVGDCHDNALCESFFATLECELLDRVTFRTPAGGRTAVFEYIEGSYNPRRRHSALGYLSPLEYERRYIANLSDGSRRLSTKPGVTPTLNRVGARDARTSHRNTQACFGRRDGRAASAEMAAVGWECLRHVYFAESDRLQPHAHRDNSLVALCGCLARRSHNAALNRIQGALRSDLVSITQRRVCTAYTKRP